MENRSLRGNMGSQSIITQEKFNEFLDNLKKATETGKKVVDVLSDVVDIKDTLDALDTLDDLEVKNFGNLGAHIVVPYKYVGRKVKVIIKKNGR